MVAVAMSGFPRWIRNRPDAETRERGVAALYAALLASETPLPSLTDEPNRTRPDGGRSRGEVRMGDGVLPDGAAFICLRFLRLCDVSLGGGTGREHTEPP